MRKRVIMAERRVSVAFANAAREELKLLAVEVGMRELLVDALSTIFLAPEDGGCSVKTAARKRMDFDEWLKVAVYADSDAVDTVGMAAFCRVYETELRKMHGRYLASLDDEESGR